MNSVGVIAGLGAYLPERVLTNADLEALVDTSDEWIRTRTGIRERHLAADDEHTADVAAAAGRAALADARLDADQLDWLLVSTDTPEMGNPATACFVHARLGAGRAAALDLTGGCAGFVQGLVMAESLAARTGANVLLIGAELISRIVDWTDRRTCILFGDGAGAVVVRPAAAPGALTTEAAAPASSSAKALSPDAPGRILSAVACTDGSQTDILAVPYGGTRYPADDPRVRNLELPRLVMDGQIVFRWAVEKMTEASLEAVRRAGLALADIALVVPHQANERILHAVGQRLHVPAERVYSHVAEVGNTGSASIGLALAAARREGRLRRGQHVLLTAFGSGFTWAAAVLRV